MQVRCALSLVEDYEERETGRFLVRKLGKELSADKVKRLTDGLADMGSFLKGIFDGCSL